MNMKLTHRVSTKNELAQRLTTEHPFHIVPRTIRFDAIATVRALAIECAIDHAAEIKMRVGTTSTDEVFPVNQSSTAAIPGTISGLNEYLIP